jgi:hypothetical protein
MMSRYPSAVREAVISAYYGYEMEGADRARTRAQNAYAVTGALAGGLLGIGLLANLRSLDLWVRILAIAAFAAATSSALLYARAIAEKPKENVIPPEDPDDPDLFVDSVIKAIGTEIWETEGRRKLARRVGLIAVALTAATLVGALLVPSKSINGTVILTPDATQSLAALCGLNGSRLVGTIDVDSLNKQFIRLTTTNPACHGRRLALPRSNISAVLENRL